MEDPVTGGIPLVRGAPLRSAAVYAIGAALPRVAGFLLLPVYARALSPREYGTISLLLAASTAVAILLSLGLDLAIFRRYFELSSNPTLQRDFVQSVWRVLAVVPLSAATLGGAVWWVLDPAESVGGFEVLLALLAAAVGVAATTVPLAVLRAEQRLQAYIVVTGTATLATATVTVFLVVILDGGVGGWLLGTILANAVTFIAAATAMPWVRSAPFRRELVVGAVALGIPLIPHFLSHWALQLADRVILAGLVSLSSVGVYSLASNLALPVLILVQSLNQGLMPTYARAATETGHTKELSSIVATQVTLVTAITLSCALVAEPLATVVAPAAYAGAGDLVPWIVLGYGFLGLYYIPMNGVSLGARRLRFVSLTTVIGVLTNIGLLLLFVPSEGLRAAAVASAIGYAVLLVAIFLYSRRPANPVRYRWPLIGSVVATAAIVYILAELTTPDHGIDGVALRAAWAVGGCVLLIAEMPAQRSRLLNSVGFRSQN